MLDGVVDSMTVYTSALTPAQIAGIAQGKRVAGAAADWEFDEGAGTPAPGHLGPREPRRGRRRRLRPELVEGHSR